MGEEAVGWLSQLNFSAAVYQNYFPILTHTFLYARTK
jgi:hypothetical protein